MIRPIAISLPGMIREEKTQASPAPRDTCGWVPSAIRDSAGYETTIRIGLAIQPGSIDGHCLAEVPGVRCQNR